MRDPWRWALLGLLVVACALPPAPSAESDRLLGAATGALASQGKPLWEGVIAASVPLLGSMGLHDAALDAQERARWVAGALNRLSAVLFMALVVLVLAPSRWAALGSAALLAGCRELIEAAAGVDGAGAVLLVAALLAAHSLPDRLTRPLPGPALVAALVLLDLELGAVALAFVSIVGPAGGAGLRAWIGATLVAVGTWGLWAAGHGGWVPVPLVAALHDGLSGAERLADGGFALLGLLAADPLVPTVCALAVPLSRRVHAAGLGGVVAVAWATRLVVGGGTWAVGALAPALAVSAVVWARAWPRDAASARALAVVLVVGGLTPLLWPTPGAVAPFPWGRPSRPRGSGLEAIATDRSGRGDPVQARRPGIPAPVVPPGPRPRWDTRGGAVPPTPVMAVPFTERSEAGQIPGPNPQGAVSFGPVGLTIRLGDRRRLEQLRLALDPGPAAHALIFLDGGRVLGRLELPARFSAQEAVGIRVPPEVLPPDPVESLWIVPTAGSGRSRLHALQVVAVR